ncbi:cell division protein FtsA [Bacteroidia bacterium]|nr:cell division protein FtsA [Bacteroidia bacterium]
MKEKLTMAIDICSSKVSMMVGKEHAKGQMTFLAHYYIPCDGLQKGCIENVEQVAQSIKSCYKELEKAMVENGLGSEYHSLRDVTVGIATKHTRYESIPNSQTRRNRNTPITQKEVDELRKEIENMAAKEGEKIIHVIAQSYYVDKNFVSPQKIVGCTGSHITANYFVSIANVEEMKKISQCTNQFNLQPKNFIVTPIASANAVLLPEERENMRVAVVDMGSAFTDIAVYHKGALQGTFNIDFAGGDSLTNEIVHACKISVDKANEVKEAEGLCMSELASIDKFIEFSAFYGQAPQKLSQRGLAEIIQPRMELIVDAIDKLIERSGSRVERIVFTGGGAKMQGLKELTESITGCEVRIGIPYIQTEQDTIAMPTKFATNIGLVLSNNNESKKGKVSLPWWGRRMNLFDGIDLGRVTDVLVNAFNEKEEVEIPA